MRVDFVLSDVDDEVKALLSQIDDVPVESSLRDIIEGYAFAYKIVSDGKVLGLEVCRIDRNHLNEREFVVLRCIKAKSYESEIDFFKVLDLGEMALCEKWNCDLVRRHIDRAGMILPLEKYGYKVTEVVLKRRLKWEKEARKVTLLHQALLRKATKELPRAIAG